MSTRLLEETEPLIYEMKYLFIYPSIGRMMGVHIETKGNDIDFPTFIVKGKKYGIARSNVLALYIDGGY